MGIYFNLACKSCKEYLDWSANLGLYSESAGCAIRRFLWKHKYCILRMIPDEDEFPKFDKSGKYIDDRIRLKDYTEISHKNLCNLCKCNACFSDVENSDAEKKIYDFYEKYKAIEDIFESDRGYIEKILKLMMVRRCRMRRISSEKSKRYDEVIKFIDKKYGKKAFEDWDKVMAKKINED